MSTTIATIQPTTDAEVFHETVRGRLRSEHSLSPASARSVATAMTGARQSYLSATRAAVMTGLVDRVTALRAYTWAQSRAAA